MTAYCECVLRYSVETTRQLSDVLASLKSAGVPARFGAPQDGLLFIDIASVGERTESDIFDLVRRAAPSAQLVDP